MLNINRLTAVFKASPAVSVVATPTPEATSDLDQKIIDSQKALIEKQNKMIALQKETTKAQATLIKKQVDEIAALKASAKPSGSKLSDRIESATAALLRKKYQN